MTDLHAHRLRSSAVQPESEQPATADPLRLRAEFVYPMADILIERRLLGQWVEAEVDGKQFELAFPVEPQDEQDLDDPGFERFAPRYDYPFPEGAQELYATTSAAGTGPDQIASVDAVRLSVTWDAAVEEIAGKTAAEVVEAIRPEADAMITNLFDRFRTRGGQSWLGLTGTAHYAMRWRLVDFAREITYPAGVAAGGRIRVVEPGAVLSPKKVEAVIADPEPITLAEQLIADALNFQWEHFPGAVPGAVLLAAVACEVRVKEVIRATAGDRLAAAELLMENPRDFSLAARKLFSDVMQAANGRSLKTEDPTLEKRVGVLFETRNAIAHKGQIPTVPVARDCIQAAEHVLVWLRAVADERPGG